MKILNIVDKRKRKCLLDREGILKGWVLIKCDVFLVGVNVLFVEFLYKILSCI